MHCGPFEGLRSSLGRVCYWESSEQGGDLLSWLLKDLLSNRMNSLFEEVSELSYIITFSNSVWVHSLTYTFCWY